MSSIVRNWGWEAETEPGEQLGTDAGSERGDGFRRVGGVWKTPGPPTYTRGIIRYVRGLNRACAGNRQWEVKATLRAGEAFLGGMRRCFLYAGRRHAHGDMPTPGLDTDGRVFKATE